MKFRFTACASAIALACLSTASAAQTSAIKEVAAQNTAKADGTSSGFANWYNAKQRSEFAAETDQIIVEFTSESVATEALRSAVDSVGAVVSGATKGATQGFDLGNKRIGKSRSILADLEKAAGKKLKVGKALGKTKLTLKLDKKFDHKSAKAIVDKLKKNKKVKFAEIDPIRYLMAQTQPWGISAVQADLVSDNEAANMTVCIIDSGYDINNPDLSGNMVSGTSDSGTGAWSTPGGSHGTHVAGTIAAINNSQGVVGVLPNQNVNLHIIKVFNDSGWGYSSDLVSAIQRCDDAGAQVVNMSLGGTGSSTSERNALQNFYDNGILLVAAAGNSGDSTLSYPASYDSVISVAAVDESGQHAEFSQYTNQVEVAGPGEAILSPVGVNDGRQGFITFGGSTTGDDRVLPPTRYVQSGPDYVVTNVNGTVSGVIGACSRTGSSYSCGNMSGKICVAERHANQIGSTYPEVDPAKACADAGAAGVVVYSNAARPGLQNPFLVDATGAVDVPTVSVNRTLGQQLVAAAGTSATLDVAGNTDYAYYNGTSMATPHVAGVAALAWSKNPTCTAAEVRAALSATADDLDVAGRDNRTGYGMVQTKAASDYMAANCGSGTGTGPEALTKGVAKTALSGAQNEELEFAIDVPAGASNLTFNLSGGSGDADLYVRSGSAPSTSTYDCRSWQSGNTESCDFSSPSTGTYYVKVIGYSAFSGAQLIADYDTAGSGGQGATSQVTNISASTNNWKYYTWEVPSGMSTLDFTITGGSGDADLYIRYGSQPTTSSYDCRPYENGNEETCSFNNPQAGTWHIGIRAYSTFSGVTLNTSYQP
ncbi:S8 family serine peptidase [Alteromonas ponticola]|uniref:S8 family serine peptidase n=1 Tax=Alteromonas ponticola TaxID=2720613 RepID=A0ABX1R4Z5_9ALTE|nr:S8 family serine peptidase [Alteromonas ponticola]NMH60561.1 S8 family serine peptidase [Alteromonas ponticola]